MPERSIINFCWYQPNPNMVEGHGELNEYSEKFYRQLTASHCNSGRCPIIVNVTDTIDANVAKMWVAEIFISIVVTAW
jgi:hypothetical protein